MIRVTGNFNASELTKSIESAIGKHDVTWSYYGSASEVEITLKNPKDAPTVQAIIDAHQAFDWANYTVAITKLNSLDPTVGVSRTNRQVAMRVYEELVTLKAFIDSLGLSPTKLLNPPLGNGQTAKQYGYANDPTYKGMTDIETVLAPIRASIPKNVRPA